MGVKCSNHTKKHASICRYMLSGLSQILVYLNHYKLMLCYVMLQFLMFRIAYYLKLFSFKEFLKLVFIALTTFSSKLCSIIHMSGEIGTKIYVRT